MLILLLGLAVTLVATACLGPGEFDPTGRAPFGSLDAMTASGDGVRFQGWVIDPETGGSITVGAAQNGVWTYAAANVHRADVGAAYPAYGPYHGFDFTVPLPPGKYTMCAAADGIGGGDSRLLGCGDVVVPDNNPFGNIDSVAPDGPGRLRASGWAVDASSMSPIDVGIVMDGANVALRSASLPRGDVGAAFNLGSNRGFSVDFPAAPGAHSVCVVAGNVGHGSPQWLGCRDVVVPNNLEDRRPAGALTTVVPAGPSSVRVAGTASDPDSAGPLGVRIAVDGGAPQTVQSVAGSFSATLGGLGSGRHEVCVTVVDAPTPPGSYVISGDRTLPCGSVVLGSVAVGTTGSPSTSSPVGPAAGTPLARVDRDAGVSVTLRDNSVLWLFGDSSEANPNGSPRYFLNNTAAWASAGSPTVTRDAVDNTANGAQPHTFVTPAGAFSTPCPAGWTPIMWPTSATRVDAGGHDRVLAFFANICQGSGPLDFRGAGISLVQWDYVAGSQPSGQPIRGTVLNQNLFTASDPYGTAAMIGLDGLLYSYQCDRPPEDGQVHWPDEFGPCTVGRVSPASAATRSAWSFWNGTGWVADESTARPMAMPAGGSDPMSPVSAMTITRDAVHNVYVMAYSPWPGFTDRVLVRVATSPQGPWTEPVTVFLPGCQDSVGGAGYLCYAGTAQPSLSRPGFIGLGYYDQLVAVAPLRGQYIAVTVPFTVILTGP